MIGKCCVERLVGYVKMVPGYKKVIRDEGKKGENDSWVTKETGQCPYIKQ